jgi:hypothetical protein
MSNQKYIISSLIIFILISFSFLAISEKRQHQIENGWFLYFTNISDNSLNFTLENYTDNNNFVWEIFVDEESITKESFRVLKNDKQNVIIDQPVRGRQIKILVYHLKEIKEIYKNFQ